MKLAFGVFEQLQQLSFVVFVPSSENSAAYHPVVPAEAGTQGRPRGLDSRFRGNYEGEK